MLYLNFKLYNHMRVGISNVKLYHILYKYWNIKKLMIYTGGNAIFYWTVHTQIYIRKKYMKII